MELILLNNTGLKIEPKIFQEVLENLQKQISNINFEQVELLLTDNAEIQILNAKYRSKDKATDVLSFGFEEGTSLGQIVISLEKAQEQAKEIGQTLEEELKFLFCHGLLHCLGYDHEVPEDEAKMLQMTYKILGRGLYN